MLRVALEKTHFDNRQEDELLSALGTRSEIVPQPSLPSKGQRKRKLHSPWLLRVEAKPIVLFKCTALPHCCATTPLQARPTSLQSQEPATPGTHHRAWSAWSVPGQARHPAASHHHCRLWGVLLGEAGGVEYMGRRTAAEVWRGGGGGGGAAPHVAQRRGAEGHAGEAGAGPTLSRPTPPPPS